MPWGVVYLEPQQSHTPFYSIIVALAAALAAGNCAALKLENNLCALQALLRTLLPEALEHDTFAIVSSCASSTSLSQCFQFLQETHVREPAYTQLTSPSRKAIAVVDRAADLAAAAEHLVTARFAFGGTSPYAQDLVFVNEHVLKHAIPFLASSGDAGKGSPEPHTSSGSKKPTSAAESLSCLTDSKNWELSVVTRGDKGAIVDLSNASALPPKLTRAIFRVSAITSLEHAISLTDDSSKMFSAMYHFGAPSTGKYLAQFINADASFVNHIPFRLLLGPAAPSFHTINIENRYNTQHFTRPSPAFIGGAAPAGGRAMTKVLAGKESKQAATELFAKATQEIKEKKRAESIAMGYFEQGTFIGLGFYGIPLLTCVGATLFFGVRAGLRRWAFI